MFNLFIQTSFQAFQYVLQNTDKEKEKALINDWSAILLCLPVLFSMNTCADFCCLRNLGVFAFGFLLRDLAVVTKFGCHID